MGTIRFELRSAKIDKHGKAPVLLNYQVSGQRRYYNTGMKQYPSNWDSTKQHSIYLDKKTAKKIIPQIDYDLLPSDKQVQEFNGDLKDYENKIAAIEKRFELDKVPYSSEMVIQKLKESEGSTIKKEAPSNLLFEFIDKYITDHTATREPGSLKVYRNLKYHLEDYQVHTRKKVTFDSINYNFFQSFQTFLLEKHKYFPVLKRGKKTIKAVPLKNTTIAKQLSTIKTFLTYAKTQGIVISDKYKEFKIKRESLEVVALTNEEFETLYYLDLSGNKRLAQVRDVFCFGCTSGLRYSDLKQLRREHIKGDEIRFTVKKTKENHSVPLTPYSKAILAKYEGRQKPLPVISSQRMNDYVKELCEKAGINEPIEIVRFRGAQREAIIYPKFELIGVHTGRKTFCTLSLEKGMSAEEVMSVSGHQNYSSFKRYVKVTEKRKKTVMLKAWGDNISDVKLKAV